MVEKGGAAEHKDIYGVSCLSWAAGRGHAEVVRQLIESGQLSTGAINSPDRYGSTPLLWTCRKGNIECAQMLIQNGADVDMSGMNGWTPLIASVLSGCQRLLDLILTKVPQLDVVDKTGMTAVMHAAKLGHVEITDALLKAKAFINTVDHKGDSALIHAVKNEHPEVVHLLVDYGADVDIIGSERKCPLMMAIEKNESEIARILMKEGGAKVNLRVDDADTCLLKATRKSNSKIVELLLEHGANVFDTDLDGNTAVHIAVKNKVGAITELLMSNPKHGRILYIPNKFGETPYNMDSANNNNRVLNQVFGARRFLPDEDESHKLLGYHLYSAALANFFSEPMLSLPITLGVFARWGSGKSQFLPRLEADMRSFCQPVPASHQSDKRWIIYLIILFLGLAISVFGYFAPTRVFIRLTLAILGCVVAFVPVLSIEIMRCCSSRVSCARRSINRIDKTLAYMHLLLCIVFLRPPSTRASIRNSGNSQEPNARPMRYLFTDRSRVTSVGGEAALAKLVASLCNEAESEYGFLAFRLFQTSLRSNPNRSSKFKLTLCIPTFIHLLVFFFLLLLVGFLLMLDLKKFTIPCIVLGSLAFIIFFLHMPTLINVCYCFHKSQFKRSMQLAEQYGSMTEEKYVQELRRKIESLARITNGIDEFAMRSTRMVVFVDGLDSCEQDKVLGVMEMVTVLFCYPSMPFIVVYCLDPVIIIKSIEQHIRSQFRNQNVRSHEYMRTVVHLPFYFPDKSRESYFLDAMKQLDSQMEESVARSSDYSPPRKGMNQRSSNYRIHFNSNSLHVDSDRRRETTSVATTSGLSNNFGHSVLSTWNLSKMLTADRDCLNDLNPREMRRLVNIISVSGTLLRADKIHFDWKKLAYWVHLTEKWSYHMSWLIYYLIKNARKYNLSNTLKDVYEDLKHHLPPVKDDIMFENDSERRHLEIFLSSHHPVVLLSDVKRFYPHTINLDPALKSYIDVPDEATTENSPAVSAAVRSLRPVQTLTTTAACSRSERPWGSSSTALQSGYFYSLQVTSGSEEHNRDARVSRSNEPIQNQVLAQHRGKVLTEHTLDDVCEVLNSEIEGLDRLRIGEYQRNLRSQNINGRVLALCDMEELKCYLNMTFGDWNLFKQWVYTKRMIDTEEGEASVTSRSLNEDEASPGVTISAPPVDTENTSALASGGTEMNSVVETNQEHEHVSFSTPDSALVDAATASSFQTRNAVESSTASETTVAAQVAPELQNTLQNGPVATIVQQTSKNRFTVVAASLEASVPSEISPRREGSHCLSVSDIFAKDFLSQECLQVLDENQPSSSRQQSSPHSPEKRVSISSNIEEVRLAADSIMAENGNRGRIMGFGEKRSHRHLRNRSSIDCHHPINSLAEISEAPTSVSYRHLPISNSLDEETKSDVFKRFKSTDSVMEKFKRSISIGSIMRSPVTSTPFSLSSSSHRHFSSLSNSHRNNKKHLSQSHSINDESLCLKEPDVEIAPHSSVSGYNSRSGVSSNISVGGQSTNRSSDV